MDDGSLVIDSSSGLNKNIYSHVFNIYALLFTEREPNPD